MGRKKVPMYRVVVADERSPRDGRFIEILGQYQPLEDPSMVNFKEDRALEWLSKGAQPTETVEKLLKVTGIWEKHTATLAPKKVKNIREESMLVTDSMMYFTKVVTPQRQALAEKAISSQFITSYTQNLTSIQNIFRPSSLFCKGI